MRRRGQRQLGFTFKKLDRNGQHRGGPRPSYLRVRRVLENGRHLHPHQARPALDGKNHPVHVTMRITRALPSLRTHHLYQAVRQAVLRIGDRWHVFRIVHISIQHDHLHLLVEARDRSTLACGLRAFAISAAKRLNRRISRIGQVFIDRYHATQLTSPTQTRNALAYVLGNWKKHSVAHRYGCVLDPFSSASTFTGWSELDRAPHLFRTSSRHEPPAAGIAHTWLLRTGWRRGGSVSVFETPGPARTEPAWAVPIRASGSTSPGSGCSVCRSTHSSPMAPRSTMALPRARSVCAMAVGAGLALAERPGYRQPVGLLRRISRDHEPERATGRGRAP